MVAPGVKQYDTPRSEALWLVLREIIRCQMVAFVVFWLAVFAPVTCQYHGLMVDWLGPEFPAMPGSMPMVESSPDITSAGSSADAFRNHQRTPDVTLTMSLFTVVLPRHIVFTPAMKGSELPLTDSVDAQEQTWQPLDPPPR